VRAGSTLFLDVGVQRDLWPGGRWPLLSLEQALNVARLFEVAGRSGARQGGIVCVHEPDVLGPTPTAPRHCERGTPGEARVAGYEPILPARVWALEATVGTLDRDHAPYIASGCVEPPDRRPALRRVFDHLTAGIRDAVVFGAGVEGGVAHAVDALLARHIRTHLVLDAVGTMDPADGQRIVAAWKRRTVDGLTTAMVARVLSGQRIEHDPVN
jgi:nicotinamidase-related amidase